MDLAGKIAAAVVAVAAGLYVRLWLLRSQGASLFKNQLPGGGIR